MTATKYENNGINYFIIKGMMGLESKQKGDLCCRDELRSRTDGTVNQKQIVDINDWNVDSIKLVFLKVSSVTYSCICTTHTCTSTHFKT